MGALYQKQTQYNSKDILMLDINKNLYYVSPDIIEKYANNKVKYSHILSLCHNCACLGDDCNGHENDSHITGCVYRKELVGARV